MAFNANTYRANRDRKAAFAGIAKAKEIKARAARGEAYAWEVERIPLIVKIARFDMSSSLFWRSFNRADAR